MYEKVFKRLIDIVLSACGLIVLSWLYLLIAIAIVIDDPGPVMFTQKRVGKNKQYFQLHKFRSMKMSTPHDMPTHMLENPDQYITRVGRFIRKTSLDELPQIWDIFTQQMAIIGPRPALWNQDDLVAERDKYGANDVLPGLTGWAQINGRDELEIPVKAKLDGEYYYIDLTWDDPIRSNGEETRTYEYFLISESDLAYTHTLNGDLPVPECTGTRFNYYRYCGLYFEEYDYRYIKAAADLLKDDRCVTLKYSTPEELQKAVDDLITDQHIFDIDYINSKVSYSVSSSGCILTIYY